MLSALAFISLRPSALRVLYSFPTRRSSDLDACDFDWLAVEITNRDLAFGIGTQPLRSSGLAVFGESACERMRDRKSTRLNSSHLVISYAVFCLKNKNIIVSHLEYCNEKLVF